MKCPIGRTLKSAAISGSLVVLAKTKIWRSWGSYFRLLLRRGTARGIEIVKRLQGLLLLDEFQPVSKQISGQHQHVYYCTPSFLIQAIYNWGEFFCVWILVASPSFAFLIQTTYNCGEVFFLCELWSPPLPLPPWSSPFTIEENRKFSFCVNFGRLLWYVATLLTSVKLCRTSEDKLRDWDKRDMTYKHLYQFHSLTSDKIGW